LDVRFAESPTAFELVGVRELKRDGYALKLEVDTTRTSIEAVMLAVLRAGSVADISIEDPPLEEVIAHIYGQTDAGSNLEARA
jgi:ABC-2 type transport system ATP-binding protein